MLDVADVERSLHWYHDLLGLAPVRVDEWRRGEVPFPSLRIDEGTIIDLFCDRRTDDDARSDGRGSNLDHFCLVVDRADVDAVVSDGRFTVVDGPGRRFGARGDGWSVYVRDPDGNTVELRSYD